MFYPYPTDAGLADAAKLVMDAIANRAVDYKEAAHAAWHLVGYGMSKWDGVGPFGAVHSDDPTPYLQAIADDPGEGRKAIPWAILLPLLLSLIEKFLKK